MRTVGQLKNDFALYFQEIERCEYTRCHFALLHLLLPLPSVSTCKEINPRIGKLVGDRYVEWCEADLLKTHAVSACGRYQMRDDLLHNGSTTAKDSAKPLTSKESNLSRQIAALYLGGSAAILFQKAKLPGIGDLVFFAFSVEGKVDSQRGIISKTALRITTAQCEEPNDMSTR